MKGLIMPRTKGEAGCNGFWGIEPRGVSNPGRRGRSLFRHTAGEPERRRKRQPLRKLVNSRRIRENKNIELAWQANTWTLGTEPECGLELPLESTGDKLPRLNVVLSLQAWSNESRLQRWMRHWVEIRIEREHVTEVECGFKLATKIYWDRMSRLNAVLSSQRGSTGDMLPKLNDVFVWVCNWDLLRTCCQSWMLFLFEFASGIEWEQAAEVECGCEFASGIYRG